MKSPRKIQNPDLSKQYQSIRTEIDLAIKNVLDSGVFSEGLAVQTFEKEFARAHGAKYCIAVNSGTSALHAMLLAIDIGPEDEVLIPTNTCFATAEAICLTGATPVFIDCEERFYNLDPKKIENIISRKTKAIIAVHLYGQAAKVVEITKIAEHFGIHLIEDCAQAHLAKYDETFVGNFGIAGAFSFYPTKNLGAYGEGGAVVTNDKEIAKTIRAIKNHGAFKKKYS